MAELGNLIQSMTNKVYANWQTLGFELSKLNLKSQLSTLNSNSWAGRARSGKKSRLPLRSASASYVPFSSQLISLQLKLNWTELIQSDQIRSVQIRADSIRFELDGVIKGG